MMDKAALLALADRVEALNKRYFLWRYWKLHHERKAVRRTCLYPGFAMCDAGSWPMSLGQREITNRKWADRQTWAACKPYDDEMVRCKKSYLWRSRIIRKTAASLRVMAGGDDGAV